ncbi:MAG: hypothetical protein JXJ20_07405 [Anaerolineae bacterium]|nr:hypothetical protein [Anaerolineae bacterium]
MNPDVFVKIEKAQEIGEQIFGLCCEQLTIQDQLGLARIGSHVGNLANNLRSALNYTMRGFVASKVAPFLSKSESKKIERNQDFPWAKSSKRFEGLPVIPLAKKHCMDAYRFLESIQPYHPGNEWLEPLMVISNTDKHVEIVKSVKSAYGHISMQDNRRRLVEPVRFFGPSLLDTASETLIPLPCYYVPYRAFALKEGKWVYFMAKVRNNSLNVMGLVEYFPYIVEKTINDFETVIAVSDESANRS